MLYNIGNFKSNIGYQYPPIKLDQIYVKTTYREQADFINPHQYYLRTGVKMKGSGIVDTLASGVGQAATIAQALSRIKELGTAVYDAYGSDQATMVKNLASKVLDKNPNARPSHAGERHIILPTKYGLSMANYCGPHTAVNQRLMEGDPGVDGITGIDSACMRHDIRYRDARNVKDIRSADVDFIKEVKDSTGNPMAKRMISGIMKGKTKVEDLGLIDPTSFTDFPSLQAPDDAPNLIGKGKPKMIKRVKKASRKLKKPGQKLKNKLLKQYYY